MGLSIFVATSSAKERQELYDEAMACYHDLADEVIEINEPWPDEFNWSHIGEVFQKGYEACTNDLVIHCDLDYIFHEDDFDAIRALEKRPEAGFTFWKYQFYIPTKYTLKSRLCIAVNKGKYGDRIKFNGGGDLCQPTLDGELLNYKNCPEARIPFYNYDALLKTRDFQAQDRARFARAYHRYFGTWDHGKESPDEALEDWLDMVKGRSKKHVTFEGTHPKYVQETINNLTPDQFGHSMWGEL